jgi:hypothetical protein
MAGILMASLPAGAQSVGPAVLNSAGGTAVLAGNTYEFSVGEMVLVQTFSGQGIVVTQGVLQPSSGTTGVMDIAFFEGRMSVYPNPAEDQVFLQPDMPSGGKLLCRLYDAAGKLVHSGAHDLARGNEKLSIPLAALAVGSYMLQVEFQHQKKSYHNAYQIQKLD